MLQPKFRPNVTKYDYYMIPNEENAADIAFLGSMHHK